MSLDKEFPGQRPNKLPKLEDLLQTEPTQFFEGFNLKNLLKNLQSEYQNLNEVFNLLGVFMPMPLGDINTKSTEDFIKTKHPDMRRS